MPAGEDIEYRVATPADREAVRHALATFYYPEEPLTMAHRDGAEVTADDLENSLCFLDQGTVIIAEVKNKPVGATTTSVVGISIAGPSDGPPSVAIESGKFADIVDFLGQLCKRSSAAALGRRPSYNVHALAVHPHYRGLSIGRRLMEQQMELARRLRPPYDSLTADATSPFSARLMERLGMREIHRMRLDEFRNEQGEAVFCMLPDATVVTLEIKL